MKLIEDIDELDLKGDYGKIDDMDINELFKRGVESLIYGNINLGYLKLKKVVEENPDYLEPITNDNPYRYLGDIYHRYGKVEDALKLYEKALNIDPNDVHLMIDRGFLYEGVGEYQKAINEFEHILSNKEFEGLIPNEELLKKAIENAKKALKKEG